MKNIVYLGGKQVGCIGLLTVLALGYDVKAVVPYGLIVDNFAREYGLRTYKSVKCDEIYDIIRYCDLMVSVHSREIVPKELLELPQYGCINVHPCLSRYKGADPVQRFFADKGIMASVGVHYMIEAVDEGKVITEDFVDVSGAKSVEEIYNILYPYYSLALKRALGKIEANISV